MTDRKRKVLFINSSVSGGGAGKALIEHIKAFDHSKIEPHVLIPFDGVVGDHFRKVGTTVHYLPLLPERFGKTYLKIPSFMRKAWLESIINVTTFPYFIFKIARLAKRKGIELIYANHQIHFPVAIGAGRISGIPAVIHSREVTKGFWPRLYFSWMVKSSVLQRVFSVSKVSAELYAFTGKTEVVYDCIDMNKVKENADPELRKQHNIKQEETIIGYLGRIIERKGVPLLIEAFAKIAADFPKTKLVIVGGNDPGLHYDLLGQYGKLTQDLGVQERVIFTGFYPKPGNYLVDFDVSVLPSLDPEPFGMVVMEAMALKIPVVIPDNSGVAEVIMDGKQGLHFQAKSADSLAKTLKKALKDQELRGKVGEGGFERAHELFDTHTRIDNLTDVLLSAMPKPKEDQLFQ
jgi:glycosyltransferase involved in cell wall biosynthesis